MNRPRRSEPHRDDGTGHWKPAVFHPETPGRGAGVKRFPTPPKRLTETGDQVAINRTAFAAI